MSFGKIPAELIETLCGRLWHATRYVTVDAVLQRGIISDAEAQWNSGRCRSMGGVSLFDFRTITFEKLTEITARNVDWTTWVSGANGDRRCGVWIELDHVALPGEFKAPDVFWREHYEKLSSGDVQKNPIPQVEACHIGTIPPAAIRSAIIVCKCDPSNWRPVADLAHLPAALADFLPTCTEEYADPNSLRWRERLA